MTPEIEIAGWQVNVPEPQGAVTPGEPPSLSVMITYYKGQHVIAEAVRSVLEQTVRPYEIVICDDGSPDNLEAGLGELREQVKVVRKQNGGTGSALNAAARAAGGDYVVQLDVDDAFLPRRLEAISAVLAARPDVDLVSTDAVIEQEGVRVATMADVNPYPQSGQRTAMLTTCTFLWPAVRRSLVLEAGGWDESFKAIEDWDCWLRLVLAGAVVAYVREPLYRWRLTPGSRSSSNRVAHVEDQVHLTEKALAESPLQPDELRLAESLLADRRRWLARERARRAIETNAPDARQLSLRLLLGRGFDRATRAKAAVATLSPGLAGRFIEQRRDASDPAAFELAQRGFRLPA
ncbi:MAG: glycosyltransferase family 2 protein [Solirubrobacteraceae bacterium]